MSSEWTPSMPTPVKGVEAGLGVAGRPLHPFKPRCFAGRSHAWVMEPLRGRDEAPSQCFHCGAVSSDHQLQKDTNDKEGRDVG